MSAAPTLSRESRWLRLGGMGLLAVALLASGALANHTDLQQLVQSRHRSHLAWIALGFLVSANLVSLALVLLLAGLRQLSLRTSVHARRGALARIGSVNLMLLFVAVAIAVFVVVARQDSSALSEESFTTWYFMLLFVAVLLAFVLVARVSVLRFRSGWKYEARTAEEVLASDPRRPVVYLRPFGVDDQLLVTTRGIWARLLALLNYVASVSPEQEMAFIMERIGPVVAIGKPGERLPELGAARRYVGDDEWRRVVGELMTEAALVVIRAGETANLWWETEEALARCSPERVIILALGPPGTLATFERRFTETFGKPVAPPPAPRSRMLATALRLLFPFVRSDGTIIYFDQRARPHEEPLVDRYTWSGVTLSPYRPYRDSLQAAFSAVFAKIGVRWVSSRNLTTAVLLALAGGMFGLHHFYMGDTRKGLWYLAFSWLALPIVLGWIDAVRLALLDDTQFQARLKIGPVPRSGRT